LFAEGLILLDKSSPHADNSFLINGATSTKLPERHSMEGANPNLITCIVQRGEADKVVKAAIEAGAEGATLYYGRGTGVREKLGFSGRFIKPEKEVILIITKKEETDAVFNAVVKAANLDKKGQGFAFLHALDRAVGFLGSKS
jgi:nitrogen regulatory protein PII